jgi:transposase-like protein
MEPISFTRHRFPAAVIRHAVWLYYRFTLSLGDVEKGGRVRRRGQPQGDPMLGHFRAAAH